MLVKMLGSIFLLLLVLVIVAYFGGWIQIQTRQDTTTIEMKTGEMKDAADKVVEKSKELLEQAGEKLKQSDDDKDHPTDEENNSAKDNDSYKPGQLTG